MLLNFYHKYINNKKHIYFQQLPLIPNHTIHNDFTRHRQNLHIKRENNKFSQLYINHNIPDLNYNAHPLINSTFAIYSLQDFFKYVKQGFIYYYVSQCTRQNCYTCTV